MQQLREMTLGDIAKTLSRKSVAILVISLVAVFIQIAGLQKPHSLPFPAYIDCQLVASQSTLDDGSSLTVDSLGNRMLFANEDGRLTRIVELTGWGSKISKALEVSSSGDGYIVHGVQTVNDGDYVSSESILKYDKSGDVVEEIYYKEFPDSEHISSVEYKYGKPYDESSIILRNESLRIDFSAQYVLQNIAFVLSCLWIAAMFVFFLRWLCKTKLQRKGRLGLVVVACILIAVGINTAVSCNDLIDDFRKNVTDATTQVESFLSAKSSTQKLKELSQDGSEIDSAISENQQEIDALNQFVQEVCKTYGREQSLSIDVLAISSDGNGYLLATNSQARSIGKKVDLADAYEKRSVKSEEGFVSLDTTCASAVYFEKTVEDEQGNPVAYIAASSNTSDAVSKQMGISFEWAIGFLAIFIGVCVAISALIMCKDAIVKCIKNKSQGVSERIVQLSGIYTMVFKFAYGADSVMVVYIAQSMCAEMSAAMQAALVALPLSFFFAGQWVGTIAATPLMKSLGERRLALITSAASIGIMLLTGWSVIVGNIIFYSLSRALMGFAISGVLYVINGTLPLYATTDEQKTSAFENSMRGSIAAAIITTLVGGYVSQFAGYFYIYILGAITCGVLFLMTLVILRKGSSVAKHDQEDRDRNKSATYRKLWATFLKPSFLIYIICFCIPNMLITGYASYLFPLFSAGAGVTPVLLSNINVFSLALMFLCQKPIDRIARRFRPSVMLTLPSLIICVGLICFMLNPCVQWAVTMVFVVSVVNYATRVSEKVYIFRTAERYEQQPTLVQANCFTVDALLQIGQSPILSVFVSLGGSLACAALGITCGAMFGIFGIHAKRTSRLDEARDSAVKSEQDESEASNDDEVRQGEESG